MRERESGREIESEKESEREIERERERERERKGGPTPLYPQPLFHLGCFKPEQWGEGGVTLSCRSLRMGGSHEAHQTGDCVLCKYERELNDV